MRIFSGIQPTGRKHLGNYIGAIRQYVEGQDRADPAIYCIVDLHATGVAYDPAALPSFVLDTTAMLLAAGLDPAITASVTAVTITPQADGLSLRTEGKLSIVVNGDTFKFNFAHTMVFTLAPSLGHNLAYVLIAQSANAGTADVPRPAA